MLLIGAPHIEETALAFPQYVLHHTVNMCSTQADNNSRKLRLRCGCQFPWCAPTLKESVHAQLTTTVEPHYNALVGAKGCPF
jgi:hypothetical protein